MMPVSSQFGLTYGAGLDQSIDGVTIESGFDQDLDAILSDIRRRAQTVFGKAGNSRRTRRVDRTDARGVLANRRLGRFDMDIARPFAGIEDGSAMISAACSRESQA